MDELQRVINNIRACGKSDIDATVTIDKRKIHVILDVLEKQIPKKVLKRQGLKNFNNEVYAIRGNCPVCGSEGLLSNSAGYCNRCGLKLDWGIDS